MLFIKKITVGIFFLISLNGCAQNLAFLGPTYTLASTGSVTHAGLSYGSNIVFTKFKEETLSAKKKLLEAEDHLKKIVRKPVDKYREKNNFKD
jgi:hypothetical protein